MAKRLRKHLSDVQIRAWISAGAIVSKSDGDGLTFTLSDSGVASWVLRYRFAGRRRELHVGRYPDMGLSDARAEASKHRLSVMKGVDVALEKQRTKATQRASWTVRELLRDYEKKVLGTLAPVTVKNRLGPLAEFGQRFGTFAVKDISYDDAHSWLEGIADANGYHAANNRRKAAAAVFKYAVSRRKATANPFHLFRLLHGPSRPPLRS